MTSYYTDLPFMAHSSCSYCMDLLFMVDSIDSSAERRAKTEDSRNGKSAFKHNQVAYSNNHTIIYLILIYNFSEFKLHILFYITFSNHHDIC